MPQSSEGTAKLGHYPVATVGVGRVGTCGIIFLDLVIGWYDSKLDVRGSESETLKSF
jgi:hypothetical protein